MGVICLHGFLGRPSDWDFLPFEHEAPDLLTGKMPDTGENDTLVAYSMGGRLALHRLLTHRAGLAVIISAGLGVEGDEARATRRAHDERWARRFERDPWEPLLRDWHAQPVFGGHLLERREKDFDRAALARALREWSPAVLEPLAPRLGEIDTPILWIAGERDATYVQEAQRAVALLPNASLWICPDTGHRVPWEAPDSFLEALARHGVPR